MSHLPIDARELGEIRSRASGADADTLRRDVARLADELERTRSAVHDAVVHLERSRASLPEGQDGELEQALTLLNSALRAD